MTELPKVIFHGSSTPLQAGDFLRPNETFDSDMKRKMTAIFATPDFDYAKSFAITSAIRPNGITWIMNKKFISQKITNPPRAGMKLFVFELDGDGFALDARREYFYPGEKEIIAVHEFDLMDEIKNNGIEFFECDEDFDFGPIGGMTEPEWQAVFDDGVKNKKFHKINL
ncbi:MAG: hypothetical protein FWC51_01730 [Proteobacteria bacterium]|nr:hypothetical protein [Pseudomonadota bacterium]